MDVGKINVVVGCSLFACVISLGCSESRGYVDYASIPAPKAAPATAANDDATNANDTAEPVDGSQAPAQESSPDAAQSKSDTVQPAVAVTDDKAGSEVIPAANSIAGDSPQSTAEPTGDATAVANYDDVDSSEPLEIKLLVPEKRFRPEGDSGSLRVSYDDIDLLKVLNMQPVPVDAVEHFPKWLSDLDGQPIRIRGFMYPTFEATGLTRFTLARDNGICCFVREPKIYDIIAVRLADGVTSDYIDNKPFDVEGTFRIVPEADDEELYQLYRIEDAKVLR
ncbi:MAG: hypothetical protein R3C59_01810 [Planctomycetaceae bacterium]